MTTWNVTITHRTTHRIEVEADTEQEAIDKAHALADEAPPDDVVWEDAKAERAGKEKRV